MKLRLILLIILLGCASGGAHAATYYVDGSVIDDAGNGAISTPKKYIRSGASLLASGDTLVIKNGTYTGANNIIGWNGVTLQSLPSGTAGNYTTIQAESVGGVVVDAEYLRAAFQVYDTNTVNYLHVDGIHFKHGLSGLFYLGGSYNWVSNCGFEDGMPVASNTETAIASITEGSYNLVEDCWVWGKGRYGFYTGSILGGTDHSIFRRVVVRLDASPTGYMSASLRFYNSNNNSMQNCIVIDSLVDNGAGGLGCNSPSVECIAFALGGSSSAGEWSHIFNGNIALNNPGRWGFSNEKGVMDDTKPNVWANSVLWGNENGFYPYNLAIGDSAYNVSGNKNVWNVSNMLVGSTTYGVALTATRLNNQYNISNSIFTGNTVSAFGDTDKTMSRVITDTIAYNNTSNTCLSGVGCTSTGLDTTTNPMTSIVRHLPRVETGTIGPNIMYQIGGTGNIHGAAGWNDTGATPLWPLANETAWSAKMKAYAASNSGDRGFAALSGTTDSPLTDYIWSYLGTPMTAAGIYAAGVAPTTTPSKAPGRYLTTQQLSLTTTAGTTKYCFGAGCTPTATYSSPFDVMKNLARQTVRVQSTDGSNVETVQDLVFLKQRRK